MTIKRGLLKALFEAYIAFMTDKTDAPASNGPADETPMQRALRLKKAAQGKHGHGATASTGKIERSSVAGPTGKSRPWMSR